MKLRFERAGGALGKLDRIFGPGFFAVHFEREFDELVD